MPQPIPELYAKIVDARRRDRDQGRTPSGEVTLINRFATEYTASEVRTAYRAVRKDEVRGEHPRWRREYDDDGGRHDILIQQPGEACTSDDAEAHAEQYLLDAKNRASKPVVSDVDEPPLVRAVRRAFAEADAADKPRPGRPALVTLTGATEYQVRVAMETVAASEPEPVPAENTLVTVGDDRSPFESIKRVDAEGDYWTGRELMPLMQYANWREFEAVIEKAKTALVLVQGADQANHHLVISPSDGGRWRNQKLDDYRLTKFGAHLVAMAGDDTKAAVAEARVYFAVQTDRAERELAPVTMPTAPAVPATVGGLAPVLYAMVDAYAQLEQRMDIMEQGQQRQAAVIERVDRWLTSSDTVQVVEWAKSFGWTQNQAYEALRETGVLFKKVDPTTGRDLNLPKVGWESCFVMVDDYIDPPGFYHKTPKITAEGQVILKAHLEKHGYELS